jgi:hypothetical protein
LVSDLDQKPLGGSNLKPLNPADAKQLRIQQDQASAAPRECDNNHPKSSPIYDETYVSLRLEP